MSSDEEIAPRRKRNVQVIRDEDEQSGSGVESVAEDSGSDGDGGGAVESSSEDDSTGSSAEDGEEEEEESEWEEIPQELLIESCRSVASRAGASPALSVPDAAEDASNGSSASDGQAERCPICLNRFLGQEEGTPESCDHVFCLDCIQEWARNVNTCPVDRSVFRLILVRQGDKMVRQISVGSPEKEEEGEEEDLTYCEVCGNCDREDRLLLCDACDLGYHCECLTPPLDTVPVEEWYCPDCAPDHSQDEPLSGDAMAEFRELLATRFRPGNTGFRRAIARTRASETVRIRIQRRRAAVEDGSESSAALESSASRAPARQRSSATAKRRKTTRRRRRTTGKKGKSSARRKTTKAKSGKSKSGRSRKKTRRKSGKRKTRTTRRSRQSARPLAQPLSVRQRIAKRLGLARTPGSSLPLMRHVDLGMGRYSRNFSSQGQGPAHGLSLFGDRDELASLDGSCDEGSSGDMVSTRRVNPQVARARAKELLLRPAPPRDRVRTTLSRDSLEPCCGDILGKILGQMQSRSPCKNGLTQSVLQRNGSLDLRKVPPNTVQKRPRSPGSSTSTSPTQNHADHAVTAAAAPSKRASGDGTCLAASSAATFSGTSGDGASRPFGGDDGDNNHAGSGRDGCFYSMPPDEYVLGKKAKDRPKNGTDNVRESEEEVDIYSDIESLGDDCANHDVGNEDTNNNNNSNNNRDRAAFSADENTVKSPADHRAGGSGLRHRSAVENDDSSSSENELVIDEQENPVGNVVEEEEEGKGEGSEEEEAALEVASVRSPSPLEENGNISRDSGDIREVVQNGNSSAEEVDEEQQSVGSADGEEGSENGEGEEQLDVGKAAEDVHSPADESDASSPPPSPTAGNQQKENADQKDPDEREDENMEDVAEDAVDSVAEDAVDDVAEDVGGDVADDVTEVAGDTAEDVAEDATDDVGDVAGNEAADNIIDDVGEENEDGELEDDDASSPKEIESPEVDENPEEGIVDEPEPVVEIASPPEDPKEEVHDGLVRGLLDPSVTEDITSPEEEEEEEEGALEDSEEEGLVEDNDMEEVSEAGSADGLLDQMDDVVIVEPVKPRRKEEGRRSKKSKRKKEGCHHRKHRRCRNREEDEDREEGEIVEERSSCRRRKEQEEPDEFSELAPRINISELPRIPKLKRDKGGYSDSGVDSGSGGEISWKKLSKHSRERSYRDGKPKDEVILFKEREIKKREREKERAELLADDRSSRREEEKRAPKKERRPDRELYVRPDKKKDWHKERSHKDKSSSSSSSSHKDRKDKHKDKEKDKQSSSSGSKDHGHHSSKDRRNDSKDRKEHHRHSSSSRHRRDHSSERSSSKTRQKESRKEDRRESRRHEERETREPRESRESRDSRRGQEEKIKVAVEKDYWKEKHERRKDRSPSPFLEVEPTPIESKEVIAKGDSIIINVNFNRRKEAKPPSPEERDSHRSRDSRSRKRALSPEYDLTDSEDDDSRKKGRLAADMDGRRDDDDESDLGEEDDDRSSIYDDGASSESDYEEKPASPLEAQESPAEEKPSKQDTTPEPLLLPSPPVVQLSPESSPPPSPPSPPEDNSYDPTELPPLPPEPEPARQPTRQQPAAPPTPTAVPPVTVAATPTTTAVPSLHLPPPPSFLAPPRSLVVANLHGAWAPTAAPVILGLRAPFVPPALGAILAPPPGMLPPPMMRVLPPTAVTATTTAAAAALPLASGAAATAPKPDHTEVVDMEVDSPYSPPDSPPHGDSFGKEVAKEADRVVSAFDALLPALAAAERKGRSKGSKKHGRTSSKDRKHIVHFTVDKGRAAIGSLVSTFKVDKSSMRMDESQLKILDELPSSAVEMQVKEK
ncbi:hypothetical protein HPB47_002112, partial [Ixodes persulcatus]